MGGNSRSKLRSKSESDVLQNVHSEKTTSEPNLNAKQRLDELYIEDIKKDLDENPEMFVLNNMLMAIMFFKNYPRYVNINIYV